MTRHPDLGRAAAPLGAPMSVIGLAPIGTADPLDLFVAQGDPS